MKTLRLPLVALAFSTVTILSAADPETFHAYVDSDVCAHVMLGPLTEERIDCSKTTYKEGSPPVLVRLKDNAVYQVNKRKMIKKDVGELVKATGEVKEKDGKVKLKSAERVERSAIPKDEPGSDLLDVRNFKTDDRLYEQVRHELAMMPYISEFDFISFGIVGNNVTLTGWTVRITNRSTAYNRVKRIEGVGHITNNIDVLPMGGMDMQVRAGARAKLQRFLPQHFWGNGSNIKIVVKNGNIILLGSVTRESERDIASIQCRSVNGAFHVFNRLKVAPAKKG